MFHVCTCVCRQQACLHLNCYKQNYSMQGEYTSCNIQIQVLLNQLGQKKNHRTIVIKKETHRMIVVRFNTWLIIFHYMCVSVCVGQNIGIIAELSTKLNELQALNKRMNMRVSSHYIY